MAEITDYSQAPLPPPKHTEMLDESYALRQIYKPSHAQKEALGVLEMKRHMLWESQKLTS